MGRDEKSDVRQGTLALIVLKTLDAIGRIHGHGIGHKIEQISGHTLSLNPGTLYPVLLKLEHKGSIATKWGISENNRKAKFYSLTDAGRRQLVAEVRKWEQTTRIIDRFFALQGESE